MWPYAESTNYVGSAAARKWNEGLGFVSCEIYRPYPTGKSGTDIIEGTATGLACR